MKNLLLITLSVLCLIGGVYIYLNKTGSISMIIMYMLGAALGVFLMNLKLNVKNAKLNSYKRELEKESIASTENFSRVKVLEAKIEVLEKALENALKK